jgi:drug/metabolite transporter (DMT)-like permease
MYLVGLLYALFASCFTFSKAALEYGEPLFLIGVRMIFAGVVLLALTNFKKEKIQWSKGLLFKLTLLGICNIWLVNAFEFWGLKQLTTARTCFIYSLSPFVSALLSYIIFREKLTVMKWLGLTIGFTAFLPLFLNAETFSDLLEGGFSWPELSVAMAAILSCYGWILLKQIMKNYNCSFLFANGFSMLLGGIFAISQSALTETWDPIPVSNAPLFFSLAFLVMVISNFLAYNIYGYLLKRYTATFLSFAGFITPLFTALFGFLFLGEMVSNSFWIASSVVFIGLYIFSREELRRGIRISETV